MISGAGQIQRYKLLSLNPSLFHTSLGINTVKNFGFGRLIQKLLGDQYNCNNCIMVIFTIKMIVIFQDNDKSNESKPISNVSQKLIDKLKERKLLEKQKYEESQDDKQQSSKKQHVLIATMLHQYYQQRDVSNMFFSNVLKYIHEHNLNVLMSNDQIKIIIMNLIQSVENWLQLIDNPGGQILRLNKEIDLPNIINQLQ